MEHHRVAIIGTGFGGIGAAIKLQEDGIDDIVLLERGSDVGGTWRDNRYPGCACDVPSHLYSFSFALNPDWSHAFSRQPEIWEYLRRTSAAYRVTERVQFETEVLSATWDEAGERWLLHTSRGDLSADILVSAAGALCEPRIPELPGLGSFGGQVLHSAQWPEQADLAGRRVGVVGTGASAVQIIPEIQKIVGHLSVFQRTPPWVLPRRDRRTSAWERRLLRRLPTLQRLIRSGIERGRDATVQFFLHPRFMRVGERLARGHLQRQIHDPDLRRMVTPTYRMGCKRILLSSDYYPALTQRNVEVIPEGVTEVTPDGVRTASGRHVGLDTLIFATGFHVTDLPIAERIYGRDGMSLAARWRGSPSAYLGVTVPTFPNLFILLGPNAGLGHTSVVLMIEAQIEHVLDVVRHLERTKAASAEPTAEAEAAFVAAVQRRMPGTVWLSGGCRSWYIDENGRNTTLWPDSARRYREIVTRFRPEHYRVRRRVPAQPELEPVSA